MTGMKRVTQNVTTHNDNLVEALAPSGTHVVLPEHFQDVGARDAGHEGRIAPRENQHRPDHLLKVCHRILPNMHIPQGRTPFHDENQEEQHHQRKPEVRDGVACDGECPYHIVRPLILVDGGKDA